MDANVETVRRIVEHWHELTAHEWQQLCTPTVRYRNMPWPQVHRSGPAEVQAVLGTLAEDWDCSIDVHHVGIDGDVAFAERTEHYTPKAHHHGEPFDVDVYGIFEFDNGRVAAWRDYFDRRALRA